MRKGWIATFLLCHLALLAACDSGPNRAVPPARQPGKPAYGDAFVVGSIGEPSTLIPILASDSASHEVAGHVYNGLVRYDKNLKPWRAWADEMKKKMSAIEEKLIQVKMKSSEGNLVYPNQLNEEFYTFSRAVEADAAPTEPQLEVFKMLDGRLEEQLQAWVRLKADQVPKINELIKQADVPALTVTEAAKPSPAAALATTPGSAASPATSSTPAGSPSPTRSPQGN
jgi:hypothetical protein